MGKLALFPGRFSVRSILIGLGTRLRAQPRPPLFLPRPGLEAIVKWAYCNMQILVECSSLPVLEIASSLVSRCFLRSSFLLVSS